MDNNIYKILDYLAPKGIGVLDNIGQPLSEIFIVTDTTDVSTVHEAKKVKFFLDNLIAENLINMPDRPDNSLGERHSEQGYRWFKDWPIGAWITLNGFNALREEKLRRTGKDLDSSIKKTNVATIGNIIMTGIFAFIVIILQIIANSREVKRDIRQKELSRIDSLKNKRQEQRETTLQNSLDSIRQAILSLSYYKKIDTTLPKVKGQPTVIKDKKKEQ